MKKKISTLWMILIAATQPVAAQQMGQPQRVVPAENGSSLPNILVIMPDDVGYWNVGAYSNG